MKEFVFNLRDSIEVLDVFERVVYMMRGMFKEELFGNINISVKLVWD